MFQDRCCKELLFVTLLFIGGSLGSQDLPYQVNLDEGYDLRWGLNETHIIFETTVKTNGYIGFGISPHGGMKGSDVVIGWVKDGQSYFSDRHADGNVIPEKDIQQDWFLLEASEIGDYTTLKMVRKLETCDPQDMPIKEAITKVIFAHHPDDPVSDDAIGYHGERRGAMSVHLLNPPSSSLHNEDEAQPEDLITIDFLNPNVSIPSARTHYQCNIMRMPDLGQKHHMIKFEPLFQKGHEKLVHHMILYYCVPDLDEEWTDYSWDCYEKTHPIMKQCSQAILLNGFGTTSFIYPPHMGYPLGSPGDPVFFRLETHYNNVALASGLVDSTGFRIYLTKDLRPNDAGVMFLGTYTDDYHLLIPPFEESFVTTGYCTEDCIRRGFGDQEEIRLYAGGLHSHVLAKKIRARHLRQGVEMEPLLEDNMYDFTYQDILILKPERVLKKGDMVVIECDFDSSERTNVTYGGFSTSTEMCLAVFLYYPKVPLTTCLSSTAFNKLPAPYTGRDIFEVVSQIDWTKPGAKELLQKMVKESDILEVCVVDSPVRQRNDTIVPTPTIKKEYQRPESVCGKETLETDDPPS